MRSNLFDAATAEKQTSERWVLQNSAMLRVSLSQDVLAAKGSMVAYQGSVRFDHEGSGSMAKFIKKLVTSEDTPLMRVSGQGEVFFANTAEHVHLILLEGDGISVDGKNLLAFDASLEWDIRRVQGAGRLSGGMWNVEVSGHGVVALTSDGPPVLLDCSQQPTGVDIQAAVAWSSHLRPQLVNSMNVRSLLRGGSGEAFQYLFHGPGFVLVQPSEGRPLGGEGGHGNQQGGFLNDLLN
ncbi:AIM24 family protein [Quadrisphaera oryzae]|uniref:AIM24 family protein n=1 Tax=Quadrisphaera TaxID=317661 RepID=UPI001644ADFA|nr:AIM24 family protein [Quadrisphaera sp. RL12-1S]